MKIFFRIFKVVALFRMNVGFGKAYWQQLEAENLLLKKFIIDQGFNLGGCAQYITREQ